MKKKYVKLFTPGPIQVSQAVRNALSEKTLGSREPEFVGIIGKCLLNILKVSKLSPKKYASILMQGSGTFGVESVIQTIIPPKDSRVLCLSNGSFGERLIKICKIHKLPDVKEVHYPEHENMDIKNLPKIFDEYKPTHVCMIHSETSTGTINPIREIGKLVKEKGEGKITFIVDAMSSWGGMVDITTQIEEMGIDFVCTSPNKCVQGVPGVAIIIANRSKLVDHSRTFSLNLVDQLKTFDEYTQFRSTPPVEVVMSLATSLEELLKEGIEAREKRYKENAKVLRAAMKKMGFKGLLDDKINGHIVSCYLYPKKNFDFKKFYDYLYMKGTKIYIYPGRRTSHDLIRIGTIGDNTVEDMEILISAIKDAKKDLKFE